MLPWKNSAIAFVILAVSGCSKIVIKDIPLYWDAGAHGAVVTHLVSEESFDVPKAQWDEQRFGYACISQPDYGWLKATLEKACSVAKICDPEEKKMMAEMFRRSDRGIDRVKSKKFGGKK